MNNKKEQLKQCKRCPLHKTRIMVVQGAGNKKTAQIMMIGEAPGRNEDEAGAPFVGRAGEILNGILNSAQIERESVYITNIVKCRPPKNRDPKKEEKEKCNKWLEEEIEEVNPKVIMTLGRHATQYFLPKKEMKDVHGKPYQQGNKTIVPMYHPAATIYRPVLHKIIQEDLKIVKQVVQKMKNTLSRRKSV